MEKKRLTALEASEKSGETVVLSGWVHAVRDHGKVLFVDLRDRTGTVQVVFSGDHQEAFDAAKELRPESVVRVTGTVQDRPQGKNAEATGPDTIELNCSELLILAQPEGDLAIDVSNDEIDLNLDTLLDNRHLSLRNKKVSGVFTVYDTVLKAFDDAMRTDGFREIKTPKLLSSGTEGGANLFKVKYFDRSAFMAQSPQFYKQAGVSAFERVFEVGTVFRAEPHYTSRHVSEYVSLDAEMGFIESMNDVMDELEKVMGKIVQAVKTERAVELALHGQELPDPQPFPRITLAEALDILEKEFGKKMADAKDIDPEGERMICEWAQKEHGSDFVFLTHYPRAARPMYIKPSEDDTLTESFDLLYRGVELSSGGQRIHDPKELVSNIAWHKMDPKEFESYIQIFRNGMPPHGGWGMGAERVVQKMLGLDNIREAILYPRDVKRLEP